MGRKRRKNNKKYIILIAMIIIIMVLFVVFINDKTVETGAVFHNKTVEISYGENDVICNGIYIGNVYVGGLTRSEAREKLNNEYKMSGPTSVSIFWNDKEVTTTLGELGASLKIDDSINKALSLCSGGNMLQRFKINKDLSASTYRIEFGKSLNAEKVEAFVIEKLVKSFDVLPTDASIQVIDGNPKIISGVLGKKTEVSMTVEKIMDAYNSLLAGKKLSVYAIISDVEPDINDSDLSSITDILGSYNTIYRNSDSVRTDRCTNVEVATANINGTILLPGESASTSDLMKERIVENGYATGGQYVNGQLEDAIGGGVCQVASTLYNALLYSEIQINKRQNHSLLVSYVDPSRDAAIATGSKDLIFTNNLDSPIYVYGTTDGYKLTFTIYGKEYRQESHKVDYISTEIKRNKSEDKKVDDPELYVGEKKTVGLTHDECWSKLEKIIYENGVEISRETISEDYYSPSQAIVHIGTKIQPTEEATEAESIETTTEADMSSDDN